MGLKGNLDFGSEGFNVISDTATHNAVTDIGTNGRWYAIKAINADAVVAECLMDEGDNFTGTIDKGDVIYGKCTRIRLTSGAVIAYRTVVTP